MKLLREYIRGLLKEDDEQRLLRSKKSAHDPNHALSVIWKKFNLEWGRKIPYFGSPTVKVYRGVPPEFANEPIRPGDWVSLRRGYAQEHGGEGSVIVQDIVNADDVYWAKTDENEYFYVPEQT